MCPTHMKYEIWNIYIRYYYSINIILTIIPKLILFLIESKIYMNIVALYVINDEH